MDGSSGNRIGFGTREIRGTTGSGGPDTNQAAAVPRKMMLPHRVHGPAGCNDTLEEVMLCIPGTCKQELGFGIMWMGFRYEFSPNQNTVTS